MALDDDVERFAAPGEKSRDERAIVDARKILRRSGGVSRRV
jgi:hypothetical protein